MIEHNSCTGCAACASICAQQAIQMVRGKDGFLYPQINKALCSNCRLCESVCPVTKKERSVTVEEAYAVRINDETIRMESSSGGAFTAFAEQILAAGGIVFGAAFDESFAVKHIGIGDISELHRLRGSKYVQSEIGDTYQEAKRYLALNITVLFSGTPCQIAGLRAYLKKDYENLVTVDVICHGVPSPAIWERYTGYRKALASSDIQRISFRRKNSGWKRFSVLFVFKNSAEYLKDLTQDPMMKAFLSNIFLRRSCYSCKFRGANYQSDITLADFWGVDRVLPAMSDDKGVSLVLTRNEKGRRMVLAAKKNAEIHSVDVKVALKSNPSYYESPGYTILQPIATKDAVHMPFDKLIQKYCEITLAKRTIRNIGRKLGKYIR